MRLERDFPQVRRIQQRYLAASANASKNLPGCPTAQWKLVEDLSYAMIDLPRRNAEMFKHYSLPLLVEFLLRSHAYYRESLLPSIEQDIRQVLSSGISPSISLSIAGVFATFRCEFLQHLEWEEEGLLKIALDMTSNKKNRPQLTKKVQEDFLRKHPQHPELEQLLALGDLLAKKDDASFAARLLHTRLQALVEELQLHALIEEDVLMERIREIIQTEAN